MNIDFGINLADELKIITTKIHSTNFARQNLKGAKFPFYMFDKVEQLSRNNIYLFIYFDGFNSIS